MVGHNSSYPYPIFADVAQDAPTIVEYFRGGVERNCFIKAVHTVLSYGLGITFPHQPLVMESGEGNEALQELSRMASAKYGEQTFAGINWLLIIKLLLELLGGEKPA